MNYSIDQLKRSADVGSKKVAEAFAKLSGSEVIVRITDVNFVNINKALEMIKPTTEHSIVAYSQVLVAKPISGVSFLTMTREHALVLVDLLNNQKVGTTGILKDLDRSALKETLNIMSNSFMTALSETIGFEVGLGVPSMITGDRLSTLVDGVMGENQSGEVVVFKTEVEIATYKVSTVLYLMFNEVLAKEAGAPQQ